MRLLFIVLISLLGTYTFAQEIPAKANTIVISLPDSSNMQKKIIKVFSDKGYAVRNAEKPAAAISTEAKTLKNSRVSLHADIKGKDIILTGNIVVVAQGNMRIENKGNKGTPILTAFEEMDKVAKAFGGKTSYEIR